MVLWARDPAWDRRLLGRYAMIYFQTYNGHTVCKHPEDRYIRSLKDGFEKVYRIPSIDIHQTPVGVDETTFEGEQLVEALRNSGAMRKRWIRELSETAAKAVKAPTPVNTVSTGMTTMSDLRPVAQEDKSPAGSAGTFEDVTDKTEAAMVLKSEFNVEASMLQNENGNLTIAKVREIAADIGVSFPNL